MGGFGPGGQKGPFSLFNWSEKWPFSTPRSLPGFQIPPFCRLPTCLSTVSALPCSWRGRERERERERGAETGQKSGKVSQDQRARNTGLMSKFLKPEPPRKKKHPRKTRSRRVSAKIQAANTHTHTQTHRQRGKHAGRKLTRGGRGKDTGGPIGNGNFC